MSSQDQLHLMNRLLMMILVTILLMLMLFQTLFRAASSCCDRHEIRRIITLIMMQTSFVHQISTLICSAQNKTSRLDDRTRSFNVFNQARCFKK